MQLVPKPKSSTMAKPVIMYNKMEGNMTYRVCGDDGSVCKFVDDFFEDNNINDYSLHAPTENFTISLMGDYSEEDASERMKDTKPLKGITFRSNGETYLTDDEGIPKKPE